MPDIHFHASEVKQCYENSQGFHQNSSEVKYVSERSQSFDFNGTEVKSVVSVDRYIILTVVE